MLKLIKHYFSLKYVCYSFTDRVSGKSVDIYVDCFGDYYLKDSRWSFFAVQTFNSGSQMGKV